MATLPTIRITENRTVLKIVRPETDLKILAGGVIGPRGPSGESISTQDIVSTSSIAPHGEMLRNFLNVTALSTDITFEEPSGPATEASQLMIRVRDDGTSRNIDWDSSYREIGITLPTTTTPLKTLYVGFKYNSIDNKWDGIAVTQEF